MRWSEREEVAYRVLYDSNGKTGYWLFIAPRNTVLLCFRIDLIWLFWDWHRCLCTGRMACGELYELRRVDCQYLSSNELFVKSVDSQTAYCVVTSLLLSAACVFTLQTRQYLRLEWRRMFGWCMNNDWIRYEGRWSLYSLRFCPSIWSEGLSKFVINLRRFGWYSYVHFIFRVSR
jgi:hypothetical protein